MGNWAFADLAAKIVYKAQDLGIAVHFVDPAYTSQTCSCCGHCERSNRPLKRAPDSQSPFQCQQCGFELNADWNSAINIGLRAEQSTSLLRQTALV